MGGYFSCANALLLSRALRAHSLRWTVTLKEVRCLLAEVEKTCLVEKEAERVMAFLKDRRSKYIADNTSEFPEKTEESHYMTDWVANYEISDYLLDQSKQEAMLDSVHFFRYNQMPEIESAEHEELMRLQEEVCFGRAVPGGSDSKLTAELEPGATRFFVETFSPEHAQLRPESWCQQHLR